MGVVLNEINKYILECLFAPPSFPPYLPPLFYHRGGLLSPFPSYRACRPFVAAVSPSPSITIKINGQKKLILYHQKRGKGISK